MLKRLYIDNIRCLRNFEIRPACVAALVGPNGGGKSTVFDVLRALQGFTNTGGTADVFFSAWWRTRWDDHPVQKVELDVQEPDGPLFQYALVMRHDDSRKTAVVQSEELRGDGNVLYGASGGEVRLYRDGPSSSPSTSFPFDSRRSYLPVLEPRPDNLLITRFKRWLSGIWLFAPRPADLEPKSEQETESLAITGANLVSWYRSVVQESPSLADEMRKSLEPMIPGLASIRLDQLGRGARVMTLECQVGGKKFPLFVDELSDGQRALLVLYTVLHALGQRASLLVFDEPDNFVAEAEIQPWLSLLRDRVVDTGKGTLLVISHHPQVVDYLAADQAFLVWRGAEGHTRVREVLVDRERGLSASEWLRLEAPHAE